MNVLIDQAFEKDVKKIKDNSLKLKIAELIEFCQSATDLSNIKNIKKLKGNRLAYRIRIGDYRVGLYVEDNQLLFVRFLHRKDIYSFFP